jgi:hypothetical protein
MLVLGRGGIYTSRDNWYRDAIKMATSIYR